MSNESVQQHLSQVAAQSIANANPATDKPDNCVKNPIDDHWHVTACIRACEGDHTAGLVLNQLLYWWPKKRAGQKGVKKSVSDWEAELMLGEKPVKRINALLIRLGLVEIYKAPWGHYKSDSTFYVLTPKALALLKAPLPMGEVVKAPLPKAPLPTGGMVSKAPLPTGVITESTKNPTENTKKQTAFVTATAPVTTPVIPETISGEGDKSKSKATPENKPKAVPAWKPAGVWERTMSEYHPKAAVPLTQIQGKILRDVRTKLGVLGLDSDLLMRFTVQHWYSVMSYVKGGSQIAPRPEFFSAHLATFVLYFNKHYETDQQRQAKQAAKAKYLAELAQELQAEAAQSPAPKKLNKFAQQVQDEQHAKAAAA